MPLRNTIGVVVLLLAAGASFGNDDDAYSFTLFPPALEVTGESDGFVDLQLEGYRKSEGPPGAPDIPIRTVLVAIPPGAEPRLEFRHVGQRGRRALVPRPVPSAHADEPGRTVDEPDRDRRLWSRVERPVVHSFAADPEFFEGDAVYPARAAWLGEIGVLRDQRYVEVHVAPVRYDARTRELVVDGALELTVHFDGSSLSRSSRVGGSSTPFESVYRRAFHNYLQGRAFRMSEPDVAAVAEISAATLGSASPLRRIVIREHGPVRLDHALFLAEAPEFLTEDPDDWTLTSRGVQVPLDVHQNPGDPSILEPGEWVGFYGQPLDDEPKTVLNADNGGNEDLYEVRDFSDENAYFLGVGSGAQPAMPTREASPGLGAPPSYFDTTTHAEVDDEFTPTGGEDPWYWLPFIFEFEPLRTESIPLPGLVSGTAPAQVRVHVRGVSKCNSVDPDHITRVRLKNRFGQTLVLPAGDPNNDGNDNVGVFDGPTLFLHDFAWTHFGIQPQLSDPMDVLVSVDDVVGCSNDVLLDWIEIDYRRAFVASGDLLAFEYPDGEADFTIAGLTSPGPDVQVYEVTGEIASSGVFDAVRLTSVQVDPDGPTFTARFRMDNDPGLADGSPRRFVVAGAGGFAVPAPTDFRADCVSTLKEDTSPADLVVVAHPDLIDSSCSQGGNPCSYDVDCTGGTGDRCEVDATSELGMLLAHRASQGITSRVARIGDVEDEFNHGLAGPLAIKNLVDWTVSGGWGPPPPSYLLLLGDASYDYKSGTANGTYVPTQIMLKDNATLGFYSSDNLIGAVLGADSLPEVVVGRISARTKAVANTVLEKIRLYEQTPPPDGWRANALFISDRATDYGDFEGKEFERINAIGETLLHEAASFTSQNLRYWSDYCIPSVWTCSLGGEVCQNDLDCWPSSGQCRPNCDAVQMRQDIQDGINGVSGPGTVLTQFAGHGNFLLWSDDVLFCVDPANATICPEGDDTQTLTNGLKLPWLLVHNCLSGGFHSVKPISLGESWLKHDLGGAIAVFAPSGLGFRFLGETVVNQVWADIFGPTKERSLAVPVLDSLVSLCATSGTPEGCQFYTLLGDPSMTLGLPQVDPPTDVSATAGNAVVSLAWTASPTATEYDVYRTTNLNLDYAKVNTGGPVTGTSWDDTTVENAQTYFYYMVGLDPDGFESGWSNFNDDCIVLGPECVYAQPLNPDPPAIPTGVVAVDTESGGRLDVTWDANNEKDLDFYTVEFGTTVFLGDSVDVTTNAFSLTGLQDNMRYYVGVKATNTSGLTSGRSALATAVPSLVIGLKAPGFVDDLILGKSGNDALLSWGAVTTDIYGKPLAVDHYEVYRGPTPRFMPSIANRIGTSATPSFTDPGAAALGQPDYHYLVRAVDSAGTGGGLGNQLPDGIDDLRVARAIGGNILISWSPVTTDFDGAPTEISHYELYAADAPFSRADIRDGLVTPLSDSITITSIVVIVEPQSRYYSVLAVDSRGNKSPF